MQPALSGVSHRRAFFVETDTQLSVYAQWGDRVAEDLRHEVTHGYLHAVVPNVPLWIDEGLAEFLRGSARSTGASTCGTSARFRRPSRRAGILTCGGWSDCNRPPNEPDGLCRGLALGPLPVGDHARAARSAARAFAGPAERGNAGPGFAAVELHLDYEKKPASTWPRFRPGWISLPLASGHRQVADRAIAGKGGQMVGDGRFPGNGLLAIRSFTGSQLLQDFLGVPARRTAELVDEMFDDLAGRRIEQDEAATGRAIDRVRAIWLTDNLIAHRFAPAARQNGGQLGKKNCPVQERSIAVAGHRRRTLTGIADRRASGDRANLVWRGALSQADDLTIFRKITGLVRDHA